MLLVIAIAGTPYAVADRNLARLRIDDLQLELEGYSTLAFHETLFRPVRSFPDGAAVSLTVDGTLAFAGAIDSHQAAPTHKGWGHGYTALSNRWLADKVPITATDGTGTVYYNRTPEDDYYLASDAGLSVGTIFTRILTNPTVAAALNALGVGAYTSLTPPTLPAATVADLALLTVVPPTPVVLSGEAIFNQLAQFLSRWHPKYVLEVTPAGLIRVKDTTSTSVFVPRTLTLAGPSGPADPVPWPTVRRSVRECATRLQIVGGPNVTAVMLSTLDGTLVEGFSTADKNSWTLKSFTQPTGAVDYGTITANTANTATITSHDATFTFATNDWSNKQAWITLSSTVNTGISVMEGRPVTANTAMTAGGSATITWDSSWPVSYSGYDKYRLVGSAGGLIDTWRVYLPREPATGHTGLNTWVGAHLVARSAKPVKWANSTTSRSEYYTTASIVGGLGGVLMVGWNVTPVPSLGEFRFTYPSVMAFGQEPSLNAGSPTTVSAGLPVDVQILALVSLGALSTTVPPDVSGSPQYQGKAYTDSGIQWTKYLNYPDWIFAGDTASMTALAQEHLDAIKDPVVEGSASWYVAGSTPSWAWMTFANSLNIAVNGASSDWTSINAPVRSIGLRPMLTPEGMTHVITWGFSTRRKPFSGDDLYTHPRFAQGNTLGLQGGSGLLVGGIIPGLGAGAYQDVQIGTAAGLISGQNLDPRMTLGEQAGSMFGPHDVSGPLSQSVSEFGGGLSDAQFGNGRPTAMGPSDLGIPMSPGELGIPMGAADLGIASSPGEFLRSQGAWTPGLGGSIDAAAGMGEQAPVSRAAAPRKARPTIREVPSMPPITSANIEGAQKGEWVPGKPAFPTSGEFDADGGDS